MLQLKNTIIQSDYKKAETELTLISTLSQIMVGLLNNFILLQQYQRTGTLQELNGSQPILYHQEHYYLKAEAKI